MTVAERQRGQVRSDVTRDQWDEAQMESAALRHEAREHVRLSLPSVKRLLDSAIRDGRFPDFQDAALLNHNLERLRRRHAR